MASSNEPEDELAKAKQESLRYFKEMEVSRLQGGLAEERDCSFEILNTQIGGKDGCLLYNGSEADGFHTAAGTSYIYPTNYPLRQYQATMVKTSLFKNTLVSLPTGLGKTFIAAVVMYNFYRWYPCGKIIFMAPTRPLVAQQIKACHDIMNIPIADTVEMTGNLNAQQRVTLWKEKRVFFLTPQVMVNDLRTNACPASLIKCLVVDEAHRAVKDYAYCQVVRQLLEAGVVFRILALSATPGNDINAVQKVIKNLNISALELRGEDALDVAPYTHSRSVDNIVVDLSVNIQRVKQDFLQVYEKYSRKLKDYKALTNNISTISKFQILKACEKFRANPPRGLPPSLMGSLICDFTVCMSLAHALELLQTYGLRAFYNYLTDEGFDKNKAATTRIRNDENLKKILEKLGQILQCKPGSESYIWGHPKYQKMVSVVSEHFTKHDATGESTRAIIFCEYRVVVHEIVEILGTLEPLVKPVMFIGQSGGKEKGMPQAKQLQIMKNFRSGEANCLVSTCVGEEGLDVGDVDLIILVETHKSLTRLIQRIGRTGRKRKGRCVVLITRGREEHKFQEAMSSRKSYITNILSSVAIRSSLCQNNPRMLPPDVNPERELVHIKPDEIITPVKGVQKKQVDIRACLVTEESPFISLEQYNGIVKDLGVPNLLFDKLPTTSTYLWHQSQDETINVETLLKKDNIFSDWIDWNRNEHQTFELEHSQKTNILCSLLNKGRDKSNLQIEGGLETAIRYISNLDNEMDEGRCYEKEKCTVDSENSESQDDLLALKESKFKKQSKKLKKEGPRVTNCMDIRLCMANAADKGKILKNSENGICTDIDIEDYDIHTVSNVKEIIYYFNSLFNVKIETYLTLSNQLCPPYNNNFNICTHFKKYMIPNSLKNCSSFEMPLLPDIETLLLEINADNISKINIKSFKEVSEESLIANRGENNLFSKHILSPQGVNNNFSESSFDFVGIDELFTETERVDQFCDNMDRYFNSPGYNIEWEEDNIETFTDINVSNPNLNIIKGIRPFRSEDILKEPCNQNNSKHVLNKNFIENKLITNNDLNKKCEKKYNGSIRTPIKNMFSPLKCGNDFWEKTPEGLNNFTLNNSPVHSRQENFISSTPVCKISKRPIFQVNTNERLSPDEWNLSDLLSDESSNASNKDSPYSKTVANDNDDTMMGITQMLSMIEKNKNEKNSIQPDYHITSGPQQTKVKCHKINDLKNEGTDVNGKKNESMPNKKEDSDIGLLDIDDDIFVGIDELMISPSSGSDKAKMNSSEGKLDSVDNSFALVENVSADQQKSNQNSDYSQTSSQVPNFKKFHCSKKRLFDRAVESTLKQAASSFETLGTKKVALSLKVKPTVKEIKSIKHKESSYFDFEFSQSEVTSRETNSGKYSHLMNNIEKHKIPLEDYCSPSSSVNFKRLHQFSQKNLELCSEKNNYDQEDDGIFQEPKALRNKSKVYAEEVKIRKIAKKENCGFLEKEADVSGLISSDDEDGTDLDEMDESFIDDQSMAVDIHSKYLQSIKSPVNGKFKLALNKNYPPICEVLSQTVNQDSEYMHDSFCVDSEEESFEAEPSLLEIAERKLARRDKTEKRKKVIRQDGSARRISPGSSPIIILSDTSSECEENNLPAKRKTISTSSDMEKSSPKLIKNKLLNKKFKRVKILSSSSDEEGKIAADDANRKSLLGCKFSNNKVNTSVLKHSS